MTFSFVVPGVPGFKMKHETRIVTPKGGGKPFAHNYNPTKTARWEAMVALCARAAGVKMIDGAVMLTVAAFYPCRRPMKKTLRAQEPKATRPDADNVLKAVADALIGIAYRDDGQVFDASVTKRYAAQGDESRTEVDVSQL